MEITAIERKIKLENSHPFAKLEEKTQILIPKSTKSDIYRTRQTHSYETASIAKLIGVNIGFNKLEELENVCLAHDLGHPPFGHTGADLLHDKSLELGIKEGFSDNSATFEVIKHNSLELSQYELSSLIKYPGKLYDYQKKYLIPTLEKYVEEETKDWGTSLKRTVACEVMDLADRISYGTSDILDSYITGYTKKTLKKFLLELANMVSSHRKYAEILTAAANAAHNKSKRMVRSNILELKLLIINDLYWDKDKGTLNAINEETFFVLNSICDFTYQEFIIDKVVHKERDRGIKILSKYFNYFIKNPEKMPSEFYYNKYKNAKSKEDKYRAIRDMVADSSDQFVIKFTEKNIK